MEKQNSTFTENLDSIREQTCEKIERTAKNTNSKIMFTKSDVLSKIQKIVETVKFEMAHSKSQVQTLKANYFQTWTYFYLHQASKLLKFFLISDTQKWDSKRQ